MEYVRSHLTAMCPLINLSDLLFSVRLQVMAFAGFFSFSTSIILLRRRKRIQKQEQAKMEKA